MSINNKRNILIGIICLSCLIFHTSCAVNNGIVADSSIAPKSYSHFEGLNAQELWRELDGIEFWAVPLNPPVGYYDSIDTSEKLTLRNTLHELIDDHHVFPYSHRTIPTDSNHKIDTWDILMISDAHPEHSDKVLDIYWNNTFDRQLKGITTTPKYDREHTWPKSLGFPSDSRRNPAYSDCHHLFPAYASYNRSRSNKPYGENALDVECQKPTHENIGRGGSLNDEPESSNYSFKEVWQTWIGRRGEVARAMFYMAIRYEGGENEADLLLVDDISLVVAIDNAWKNGTDAYMGVLSTLLQWHIQDPVDDLERRRNSVVYLFQGNRNPFIDHPEWVIPAFTYSD